MVTAAVSIADRIFERLTQMEIGEVLCYHDLEQLIGRPAGQSRSSLYQAIRRLQKDRKRTLSCVANVGYRLVPASEHEKLARVHHKKSQRQLKRAAEKLESADRAQLTEAERKRIDSLELTVKAQQEAIRHLEVRQAKQEKALDNVRQQTSKQAGDLAERMARMESMLERIADREAAD